RNTPPPEHARLLAVIERQVSHLKRLVDDLLDVSRLTRGKITLRKAVVDLNELVEQALESCQPLITARRHRAELRPSPEPLAVEVDTTRIVQSVVTLLTNAAKYTPRGGTISIAVEREGNEAVVRVKDTGMGIPDALLPQVFTVFVQGNRALDRPEGGLGIGLTVVKRLVELHGGSVSAFSRGPHQGSEFTIRLPVSHGTLARSIEEARP